MYILLNENGNVITSIPHTDTTVRQGNDFDLHICFPAEARFLNLSPFAEFSVNGKFVLAGENDYAQWGLPAITFQRADLNEAVFEFKPGQNYYCYHIHVPKESGITSVSGALPMVISVVIDDVSRQGRSTINVIKTYGSDDVVGIDTTNLDALMSQMKMATNIFQFDCQPRNGAILKDVIMYSWKTLGFVRGFVQLGTPLGDMPEFEDEPGYSLVAVFPDCADVTVPSTFMGHTIEGADVEFKIAGDRNPTDRYGTAYLLINKDSEVTTQDKIALVGSFMVTQNTFYFKDGEETSEGVPIQNITATARSVDEIEDPTVTITPVGEESAAYNVNFDFAIPKGETGQNGLTPTISQPGATVTSVQPHPQAGQADVTVSAVTTGDGFSNPMHTDFRFGFRLPSGIVVEGMGAIAFGVNENGHLIAYTAQDEATGLSIDESTGHLIFTY